MKSLYSRFIILLTMGVFAAKMAGAQSAPAQPTLAEMVRDQKAKSVVLPVKKTVFVLAPEVLTGANAKDDLWRRGFIGFGLENTVAQKFYDSGAFDISEEKPEVVRQLQLTCATLGDKIYAKNAPQLPVNSAISADYIALCRINSFSTSGSERRLTGPRPITGWIIPFLKKSEAFVGVTVDVCLFDARTGERKAKVSAEDHKTYSQWQWIAASQTLAWNPSLIGPATDKAVNDAVSETVKQLQLSPVWPNAASSKADGPLTLAVMPLGLRDGVEASFPLIADRRLCMGMTGYITKSLSEIEGKNLELQPFDPGVQEEAAQQYWVGKIGSPRGIDAVDKWKAQNKIQSPRWIVYGQLYAFSRTTGESSGVRGEVQDRLTVGVQLRAVAPCLSAEGAPCRPCLASVTTSIDGNWGKWDASAKDLDWNDSLVEKGLKDAIGVAWKQLFAKMQQTPLPPSQANVTLVSGGVSNPVARAPVVTSISTEVPADNNHSPILISSAPKPVDIAATTPER